MNIVQQKYLEYQIPIADPYPGQLVAYQTNVRGGRHYVTRRILAKVLSVTEKRVKIVMAGKHNTAKETYVDGKNLFLLPDAWRDQAASRFAGYGRCSKCGEYYDHLGRCGCDYRKDAAHGDDSTDFDTLLAQVRPAHLSVNWNAVESEAIGAEISTAPYLW